jgi:hypothetical protein
MLLLLLELPCTITDEEEDGGREDAELDREAVVVLFTIVRSSIEIPRGRISGDKGAPIKKSLLAERRRLADGLFTAIVDRGEVTAANSPTELRFLMRL